MIRQGNLDGDYFNALAKCINFQSESVNDLEHDMMALWKSSPSLIFGGLSHPFFCTEIIFFFKSRMGCKTANDDFRRMCGIACPNKVQTVLTLNGHP
jgi:hypothetical protein